MMSITRFAGFWSGVCAALILESRASSAVAGTLLVDDSFLQSVLAYDSAAGRATADGCDGSHGGAIARAPELC